jgi:hypothetical protein
MPDFPIIQNVNPLILSPAIPQSVGNALAGIGLATGNQVLAANKALYVPVSVQSPITIVKMFVINGTAVSGNIDVGIYDQGGVRLVSIGSTAQSGTSAVQEFDITDTTLNPGLYYLAVALDNGTGAVHSWAPSIPVCRAIGIFEQATAFPLPATATFATSTVNKVPFIGATQRSVV